MGKNISALLAGLIFGLGLTVSQMINPAKVTGFLDVFGNWDPSLAFVMGGAVLVTSVGYRLAWRRSAPIFEPVFEVPTNRTIDTRLAVGAILFGLGWGLIGLCPGPAMAGIFIGGWPVLAFLASMSVGMAGVSLLDRVIENRSDLQVDG